MIKRAKKLKSKGFSIESRNKFGKVVFKIDTIMYERYKNILSKHLLKVRESESIMSLIVKKNAIHYFISGNAKTPIHTMIVNGEKQVPRLRQNNKMILK